MRKPLEGIRVLDLSRVLAGPWCSQQLADLGAEVIKIERPGSGDDTRAWGPPWLTGTHESAYFLSANRGKRSVVVNLASSEGQQLIRDLVSQCDVLIENFKAGGLESYGLDYASLKAVKPDLIYCSITGFGQDGPYAHRAGYDFIIQGMGGLMSLTGHPDDVPGGEPMKVGVASTIYLPAYMQPMPFLRLSGNVSVRVRADISTWRCSTFRWLCLPTSHLIT